MTDPELFDMIAKIWVENGGDAEGFDYCWWGIKDAIKRLMEVKCQS